MIFFLSKSLKAFASELSLGSGKVASMGRRVKENPPYELVAKSTGTVSEFTLDDRVFHQKFGYGNVVKVDGNKLTIAFEKAGEKKVVDSFVERV